ncbi:MAG: right-handed parallel beta-helix repeat-containing protein [Acidimicrobiia bacterium]
MSLRAVLAVVTAAIALAAPGLGAALPAGAASTVRVPGSIDASGATDVTDALNRFFAGLPQGTTVEFPQDGRFTVEGIVYLKDRHGLTIEGNGATLQAKTDGAAAAPPGPQFRRGWPRVRDHLDIQDSSSIVVRDLTVEGPNAAGRYVPKLEAQAAFSVRRSQDVTLDHVAGRNTYGDGVYITGPTSGVHLRDCTFDHNGRQGVAVVAGTDITIDRCAIRSPGRSAIDLEPGRGAVTGVHIRDNEISDATNTFLAAVGGGTGVDDVWLERNRVHGGRGLTIIAGVPRFVRKGLHVLDNTGDGTSAGFDGALMRFTRWDGLEIRGNHQAVTGRTTPIVLTDSCNVSVAGNDFGSGARPPRTDGDCTAPGLRTPRPVAPGVAARRARAAARRRRAQGRQARPSTTAPTAPVVVTRTKRVGGSSPVTVALAFAAGAAAGAAGMFLAQWTRRRASEEGDGREDEELPAAEPVADAPDDETGEDTPPSSPTSPG